MARHVYYDSEGNDITDEYYKELEELDKIVEAEAPRVRIVNTNSTDHTPEEKNTDLKMSCRETILEEAKRCICTDRQNQYGPPEDSFAFIAQLWTVYLDFNSEYQERGQISASDVANMMILLKIARTKGYKGHTDNYVDICGYGALAAELSIEELEL